MFSSIAMEHIRAPRGRQPVETVTHRGRAGIEGDGPFLYLDLTVSEGVIRAAFFKSMACPASIACGSILCEIILSRGVASVSSLEATDIVTLLGGLPEGKMHCAALAASALKDALRSDREKEMKLGEN